MFQRAGHFYNILTSKTPVTQLRRMYRHLSNAKENHTILSEIFEHFITKGMGWMKTCVAVSHRTSWLP